MKTALKNMLVAFGVRRWRDVDHDLGWTLQECEWTRERRTVVYGQSIRRLVPGRKPRWERATT